MQKEPSSRNVESTRSPSTQTRSVQVDNLSPKTRFDRKLEEVRANLEFLARPTKKPKERTSLWNLDI